MCFASISFASMVSVRGQIEYPWMHLPQGRRNSLMTHSQRQVIANIALRDIHPGWLPSMEPLQLASATGSPWGRRWLARHLEREFLLFDDRWNTTGEFIRLEGWVYLPSILWSSWLIGLGALSLGLPTRIGSQGDGVRKTYIATHDERYSAGNSRQTALWPDTDIALEKLLSKEGVRQLHHHAIAHHPFAADRVKLAFAPVVTRVPPARVLPSATVRAFMAAVMIGSDTQEASPACPQSVATLTPIE